ncbi:MAG: peptide transporter [Flavobacteriales bacterium]|nr:peptide transporter [Flavobacteriales bacterium]
MKLFELINRASLITKLSLLIIFTYALLSIFGFAIVSDKSKFANDMNLQIATLKPLSKLDFILIDDKKIYIKEGSILINKKNGDLISFEKFGNNEKFILSSSLGLENIQSQFFLMGTDKFGRDFFSRIIYGMKVSLTIGFLSVLISLAIGIFLGSISGFYGGNIDKAIMWLINVTWSIPTLLLVIAISLAIGKGFNQVFIAIGLTMWVDVARIVRGQFMSLKEKEFVEAGEVLGYKSSRLIVKHILPNILSTILVISTANFSAAILLESGLSFLGLGAQPPVPTWGSMLRDHYYFIFMDKSYLAIIPGLFIMTLVLSFINLGNGLRDLLDVKN